MKQNIDEELKNAERDKYLAEAAKANAERDKIDFEIREAQKEIDKKWWKKSKFRQNIIPSSVALAFLGVFINFAVVPAFQVENFHLKLENERVAKTLFYREQELHSDSLELKRKIQLVDSLSAIYRVKVNELNIMEHSRDKVDSSVSALIFLLKYSSMSSNEKIKQANLNLERQRNDYEKKFADYESKLHFTSLFTNAGTAYTPPAFANQASDAKTLSENLAITSFLFQNNNSLQTSENKTDWRSYPAVIDPHPKYLTKLDSAYYNLIRENLNQSIFPINR